YPSDVIRLDVLYRYGGIYIDTDILVKKPFDEFLNLPAFWTMQFDNTISTSIFGAEAGNSFIKTLLDQYKGFDRQMMLDGRLPETNNEII
ncbi:glycosyl transferase, partial [Roseburia faecis]|nr:glycosyl transferase [Roseburia faecis]